jgi:N-acetylglucosamine repressor
MNNSAIDSKNAGLRNEKLVISLLKEHGDVSQAQLCKLTGLGSSTISYIVARLREKDLIIEKQGRSNKRGARPVFISINPRGKFAVGVEINPSMLVIGLFDFNCELIESIRVPLESERSVENVLHLLEINLKGLMSKHGAKEDRVIGLGITLSGSVSSNGVVELSSPMGWKKVPLKNLVSARFKCPVEIYTTRVRLLAETGAEPELAARNVLYLNVGNGVGSTIIIDGRLIHGASNRCGEIGHVVVEPDGPICGCGHKGCLEALISGPALARRIRNDIWEGVDTVLGGLVKDEDLPEEVVSKWGRALREGDSYAESIRELLAEHLSRLAAVAINCFDPEVVILAGYVSMQCFDYLAEAIKKKFGSDVYGDSDRSVEIVKAKAGDDALIQGVVRAVLQDSLELG